MNHGIPNGADHVTWLDIGAEIARRGSLERLKMHRNSVALVGVSLTTLYQAATCHRECHGGPHILEAFCGRAYNLAAAAIHLGKFGFYDEAFNLIRGVGEIANIVFLSVRKPEQFQIWLNADDKTRRNKYGPGWVRKQLDTDGEYPLVANYEWYSALSENTHVNPGTRPNYHNDERRRMCGGIFQKKGLDEVMNTLGEILVYLALFITRFFKFDDLFEELCELTRGKEGPGQASNIN